MCVDELVLLTLWRYRVYRISFLTQRLQKGWVVNKENREQNNLSVSAPAQFSPVGLMVYIFTSCFPTPLAQNLSWVRCQLQSGKGQIPLKLDLNWCHLG